MVYRDEPHTNAGRIACRGNDLQGGEAKQIRGLWRESNSSLFQQAA